MNQQKGGRTRGEKEGRSTDSPPVISNVLAALGDGGGGRAGEMAREKKE